MFASEKLEPLKIGSFYRYKQGGNERFKIVAERKALAIYRHEGEVAILTVATLGPEYYVEVPKEEFDGKVKEVIADLQAVLDGKS